jgi:hypothetical protein
MSAGHVFGGVCTVGCMTQRLEFCLSLLHVLVLKFGTIRPPVHQSLFPCVSALCWLLFSPCGELLL